jgi:hypothetical protein
MRRKEGAEVCFIRKRAGKGRSERLSVGLTALGFGQSKSDTTLTGGYSHLGYYLPAP